MKEVQIGNKLFKIKDYYCSQDKEYLPKDDGKLWLYINVCNICQADCPFCISPSIPEKDSTFDILRFRRILRDIKGHINGISLTGGEPLLFPELVDKIVDVINSELPYGIETDIVTNGVNLSRIMELHNINKFDSIHISRHMIMDEDNQKLMKAPTPTIKEIAAIASKIRDSGKLVFNCVLQKGGIDSIEKVKAFLEMAAKAKVLNTSFIGMFLANDYCKKSYVNPKNLDFDEGVGFSAWNHYYDHDFCSCSTGSYNAKAGTVGYYYRCPGDKSANYARQLVYTTDNRLLAGFGGEEIQF